MSSVHSFPSAGRTSNRWSRPLVMSLMGLVLANLLSVYFAERGRARSERKLQEILTCVQVKDSIINDLRFQIVRMHGQNQAYRALLESRSPSQPAYQEKGNLPDST